MIHDWSYQIHGLTVHWLQTSYRLRIIIGKKWISNDQKTDRVGLQSFIQNDFGIRRGFAADEVSSMIVDNSVFEKVCVKCNCGEQMKMKINFSNSCDLCDEKGFFYCENEAAHINGRYLCMDCAKDCFCSVNPGNNKQTDLVQPSTAV